MQPTKPQKSRCTRFVYGIAILIFACGLIELVSFAVVSYLQHKGVFYDPPSLDHYTRYLKTRDPVLGWPAPDSIPGQHRDATGARISPALADSLRHATRVSLYGDSFTWGSEVDDEHAWGNVLSQLLGQKVANFGVGGYGTDHALLRFLHNEDDEADIVFLNHLSSNIMRNVAQYYYPMYRGSPFAFKPRYILDENGSLVLIPIPTFSELEIDKVLQDPERYLPYEYFVPGGPSGLSRAGFPFLLSAFRAFGHFHIKAKMQGRPWHMDFFSEEHPSNGLRVTAGIMAEFTRIATERGKIPVITILPTGSDLVYYRDKEIWPYQNLIDVMAEMDIEVVNVGERMNQRLGARNPRILFRKLHGHYNEYGNEMLANIVYEYIQENELISRANGGRARH